MVQTFAIETLKCRFDRSEADALLQCAYGPEAQFREGQWEALEAVAAPGARTLLVQATGWGKSVVYFTAAGLVRTQGLTLVVSPLIALMRNQVQVAARFGLRAGAIHSENRDDWPEVTSKLDSEALDVLFVSPERLQSREFRGRVLDPLLPRLALVVIDEAHCISEWGHDFRPEYRSVLRNLRGLPIETPILAATATATARVEEDLRAVFGPFLEVRRGRLVRPSLRLVCAELPAKPDRLAWLAKYLPRLTGSGIVYVLTVYDAKEVSRWLGEQGIDAPAYHAELSAEERIALEQAFSENRVKALVATTALGMGYDKADVGFVVHYQTPASLVGYYQQIGRAGRALDLAQAVLLAGAEDKAIVESFATSARPPQWVFEAIAERLQASPARFDEIARRAGVAGSMVRHALDILDAGEAVWRDNEGLYHLDPALARAEIERGEAVRDLRRAEFRALADYIRSPQCRMKAIAQALGDPEPADCGICDRCHPIPPFTLDPRTVAQASAFCEGAPKTFVPRAQLPLPLLEGKRRIPPELRNRPGIVLGVYSADRWGELVKAGKYEHGRYAGELLEASLSALSGLNDPPAWLTWVPSRRPGPLPDFARRLADRLGIEAVEALCAAASGVPQKTAEVSEEQFLNVWHAFEAMDSRPGVCLLLDDIVDSGWTLTIAGLRLRQAGSGPVLPFALAAASSARLRFPSEGERS